MATPNPDLKIHRGYWWGEPIPADLEEDAERELTDEEKYKLPPLPPIEELIEMHPEVLREMEKKYLDQAVWKRDEESVTEYYTLVKAFRAKSRGFAAAHNYVSMSNPSLSTNDIAPSTPAGITAKKAITIADLNTKLKSNSRNYGLIVFESKSCRFCTAMKPLFRAFQNRHGWTITHLDIEDRPDLVAEFNIQSTPTALMIKAGTDKPLIVANGVISLPKLEMNIYRSVRLLNDEITLQQFLTMEHQMGSSIDPVMRQ